MKFGAGLCRCGSGLPALDGACPKCFVSALEHGAPPDGRKPYHPPRLVPLDRHVFASIHLCGVFLCMNEAAFTFLMWDGKRGKLCAECMAEIRSLVTSTHGERALEHLEIEALERRVVQ